MVKKKKGNIPPYCKGAEMFCMAYEKDGVVACEKCEYHK